MTDELEVEALKAKIFALENELFDANEREARYVRVIEGLKRQLMDTGHED